MADTREKLMGAALGPLNVARNDVFFAIAVLTTLVLMSGLTLHTTRGRQNQSKTVAGAASEGSGAVEVNRGPSSQQLATTEAADAGSWPVASLSAAARARGRPAGLSVGVGAGKSSGGRWNAYGSGTAGATASEGSSTGKTNVAYKLIEMRCGSDEQL